MKLLKDILARILAFWALVSFVATFLIIVWPSLLCWLLPDPKGQRVFVIISRIWMNIWLRLVFLPFRVRGQENFKKGETYVVTFNHNSLLDVPLSFPFLPGSNKTIAKSSFAKVPLFGWYYMKGAVLVNRKSEQSRRDAMTKMKNTLAKGMHMAIYPEGTRNRSSEPLKKFHDGAFRLAVETGKDVLPALIFYTKDVLPVHKPFWFWPRRIEMEFFPAISSKGKTVEELKEEVFATMSAEYLHKVNDGRK